MLSKFIIRPPCKLPIMCLEINQVPTRVAKTNLSNYYIPPSQYDTPWPDKMKPAVVLTKYWETIPLFFCTCTALGFMFGSILWAIKNKVDVVFVKDKRSNISRTMDLRHPTIHKIITINQKYEPWPEMQDVLDKMAVAEKKALVRAQACSQAAYNAPPDAS